jgi:hypothetical protein
LSEILTVDVCSIYNGPEIIETGEVRSFSGTLRIGKLRRLDNIGFFDFEGDCRRKLEERLRQS